MVEAAARFLSTHALLTTLPANGDCVIHWLTGSQTDSLTDALTDSSTDTPTAGVAAEQTD